MHKKTWIALFASASALNWAPAALGQAAVGQVLHAELAHQDASCTVLNLVFEQPVQAPNYFPQTSGNQVTLRVRPLQGGDLFLVRQAVAIPKGTESKITDIDYDGSTAAGPMLTISFARKLYFQLAPGKDFMNILLAVSIGDHHETCLPTLDQPQVAISEGATGTQPLAAAALRGQKDIHPPNAVSQALFDDAKAALTAKDYAKAVRLLTKFVEGEDNTEMADAYELLGVAHERANQEAEAKAAYDSYLKFYPDSAGAGRVRQRLEALLDHGQNPNAPYTPGADPPTIRWEANTTVSEYFYHDEMALVVRDSTAQITIDQGLTSLQTLLVSGIDSTITATGEDFRMRLRTSGSYTQDFIDDRNSRYRVSEWYLELSDIDQRLDGRIGRQYRSDEGILGRFDGGLFSARLGKAFKVDVMGGLPADTSYSSVDTSRWLVASGLGYTKGPLTADVYGLYQTDHGLLDRESVGFDARYVAQMLSVYSTFDYDVHFNKINVGLVNTNLTLADQTSFNLSFDYRSAPLLRTSNALIGQPVTALDQLLLTYTIAQIEQLAQDRTATSLSIYGSVSHPLSDKFSVGLDATLWRVSGMPESGGIAAIPGSGDQYYFSGNVTGISLFTDGDMATLTGGYSKMLGSDRYVVDFDTRYPVLRSLRIGPRLFASYRTISVSGATAQTGLQTVIRPTLKLTWRPTSRMEFDVEGGTEWQHEKLGTTATDTQNYLVSAGIVYNF